MSEIFIPGIRSRFNTDQLIEDTMRLERMPRERAERAVESLEMQRTWWQDLGRRIGATRESARFMFSFQNPFNNRTAVSSDPNVITATATREAAEREYSFSVRQLAQADRFLSTTLDERTRIEAGTYTFTVGDDEISLNFRGGTLREFADALNRRGRDRISASLITVQPGTRSLLIESRVTGAENRLGFADDALPLAVRLGIAEQVNDYTVEIPVAENTVRETQLSDGGHSGDPIAVHDGVLTLPSRTAAVIPLALNVGPGSPLVLRLETTTSVRNAGVSVPLPPPGPNVPSSGAISHGGITVANIPSTAPLPEWTPPPPPPRVDNLSVFSLTFSDGSRAALPAIADSGAFLLQQHNLADIASGRTITGIVIENDNTHRDISVRGLTVLDPNAVSGNFRPLNAVSTAQDAIIAMEGIEMIRPSNSINDIIPGVTITARSVSDRPVRLDIQADREGVKEAIITLVGNYNRLMAELNVLTRNDPRIIDELTYLTREEAEAMRERLGAFSTDSSLNQLRNNLLRAVTGLFPTDEGRDLAMLAQIGISTNARGGGGGINVTQLRGYLEIDERMLDRAIEENLPAIRQLFGADTDGDLIVDTGVAFYIDALSRPFVETGGIVALRTATIDSRVRQDTRRIEAMDEQLARREADLRIQYSRMESAWARMESLQNSLNSFQNQNNNR